jgi:Na+/H+-dicarboxylate symporter
MFLGIAVGLVLRPSTDFVRPSISMLIGEWIDIPGYIFIGLLQMIVVSLVFVSIIRGIATGERSSGRQNPGYRTTYSRRRCDCKFTLIPIM